MISFSPSPHARVSCSSALSPTLTRILRARFVIQEQEAFPEAKGLGRR